MAHRDRCPRGSAASNHHRRSASQQLSNEDLVRIRKLMEKKHRLQALGEYTLVSLLGKGAFGRVYRSEDQIAQMPVAVKIVNLRESAGQQAPLQEASIQAHLRCHPNVATLYEAVMARNQWFGLILELCEGGPLQRLQKKFPGKRFPEPLARIYARQLLSAIEYMQHQGVAHRDLKMDNILLHRNLTHLKIIDFGLSGRVEVSCACGSVEYAAPEVLEAQDDINGTVADLWSWGVVLYKMVTGRLPFRSPYRDHKWKSRLTRIAKMGLNNLEHEPILKLLSPECCSVLYGTLEPDRSRRLSMAQLVEEAWLCCADRLPFCVFRPRPSTTDNRTKQQIAQLKAMSEETVGERLLLQHASITGLFLMLQKQRLEHEEGFFLLDHTSPEWPLFKQSLAISFDSS
ncbi:hypothetical protein Ciccas_000432 [Cichlidogyrus casuarinus]|uniref:Protein kinase domain-containing protein n=1 Tax=Cichlidogyrus casuarinus TaxID=1844966 RepID=A0ABD2QMW1_9PLAT